ncbi:MAG: peptide deformylase [Clostridia bacterium]|nr:peptide deformylase [Clostridia bacterium]
MALRTVRVDEDPILRKTSKKVEEINDKIIELLDDMYDTMVSQDGVGIAAVQVGVLKRMVLVCIPDPEKPEDEWMTLEMINPEILERSTDTQIGMEGCLSVPGKQGEVERPKKVKVKYYDRDMEEHIEEYDSFGAIVCCHEIDHLDGILYTDKAMNLEDIPVEE